MAQARTESQGTRGIVRGAMLMAWCFVLWGSLIVLATAWTAVTRGGGVALRGFARLSLINQVLALAALVAWGLAAWALLDARLERDAT